MALSRHAQVSPGAALVHLAMTRKAAAFFVHEPLARRIEEHVVVAFGVERRAGNPRIVVVRPHPDPERLSREVVHMPQLCAQVLRHLDAVASVVRGSDAASPYETAGGELVHHVFVPLEAAAGQDDGLVGLE